MKGQIATLIQQEKERQQAALQAALQNLASSGSSQGNGASRVPANDVGGDTIPNLPAPSPRAAAAIAYAEAQLGKPYQYAASGPNTFDCSGLTMMAWAAAGVSMPHYSGAQYEGLPHVPLDQLEPGDLLFWGVGRQRARRDVHRRRPPDRRDAHRRLRPDPARGLESDRRSPPRLIARSYHGAQRLARGPWTGHAVGVETLQTDPSAAIRPDGRPHRSFPKDA